MTKEDRERKKEDRERELSDEEEKGSFVQNVCVWLIMIVKSLRGYL